MTSKRQKKALAKRARAKLLPNRQPDGRVRPERPSLSVAQYRREVQAAALGSHDPLIGTQIGRCARLQQITREHLEAGLCLAETYGRYDLAMGCRRTAASPSYEIGRRATGAGVDTSERDEDAVGAYDGMMKVLHRCTRGAVILTERLCVDDEYLMADEMREVCPVLDLLAGHFCGHKPSARTPPRSSTNGHRDHSAQRTADRPLESALAALVPMMAAGPRRDLYDELMARIARARLVARKPVAL
jgi:hypothetical protein